MHHKRKFNFLLSTILVIGFVSACSDGSKSKQPTEEAQVEIKKDPFPLKYTSGIRSILEENKGNIWFGSHQEGAALFDGEGLTYFTVENGLSDNQIRTIYEDEAGTVWFEGGKGLSNYNGQRLTTIIQRDYSSKNEWKLSENNLWFKGDESTGFNTREGQPGVYRYDGDKLIYQAFPIELKAGEESYYSVTTPLVKGKDNMIWFGTYGAAIGYNGTDFKIIKNESLGLTGDKGALHIRSLLYDSKGNLWIGNNGFGVLKYDGKNIINFTELHHHTKAETGGNSLEKIFSIGEDNEGNIWFGTYQSGVWRFDGESLTNFTEEDGLPSNQIWTIYNSKHGELWFGGADPSGVYVFNGSSFKRKY
ncbi:ligand-binding sensor domain-containing protein [Fulvivirga lutimaris]|uniref:ligand-binding sensor domain-containing protein n=1 Tax=Fulvivirga lutimaris TaxID=1819566 RepID=UPI001624D878|nr:two-component regulator propeller domain-containing protein [Fulvivirga lutimaris]